MDIKITKVPPNPARERSPIHLQESILPWGFANFFKINIGYRVLSTESWGSLTTEADNDLTPYASEKIPQ